MQIGYAGIWTKFADALFHTADNRYICNTVSELSMGASR